MDKKISTLIQNYSDNELLLNKLVVSSCCRFYGIEIGNGYLSQFNPVQQDQLEEVISVLAENCSIENVISIFERAIPQTEKTANGAIYTPKFIRDLLLNKFSRLKVNLLTNACVLTLPVVVVLSYIHWLSISTSVQVALLRLYTINYMV